VHNRSTAPVDFSVLEEIEQQQTLNKLNKEPTMLEIIKAIKVMRSNAAPGESGVIGKCLKDCSSQRKKSKLFMKSSKRAGMMNKRTHSGEWHP
jgi:hypothetical protein